MATRGWNDAVGTDTALRKALKQPRNGSTLPQVQRSKYRAVRTVVDGITFDSKREAARYAELKALQKAGKIFRLRLQPEFRLCVWRAAGSYATDGLIAEVYGRGRSIAKPPCIGIYRADFAYCNVSGCFCCYGCTVEDVKGFKTPMYRWKKKHVEAQYGIQIRET